MAERSRVASDLVKAVAGRALGAVLTFAAVVLVTRLLHPADYGRLSFLLVTISVAYALIGSWSGPPVLVIGARELQTDGRLTFTSTARVVMVGRAALAVFIPGVLALLVVGGLSATAWLALLVATLGFLVLEHTSALLEVSGRYGRSAVVQTLRPLAYVVALIIARTLAGGSLDDVLWAVIFSWASASIAAFAFGLRRLPIWPPRLSAAATSEIWSRGRALIPYMVSQLIFGALDLYFIRAVRTDSAVGQYGLAYQCFSMGAMLALAVIPVLTPRLAREDADSQALLKRFVGTVHRRLHLALGGVALGAALIASPLLVWIFGDRYADAAPPVTVLVLAWMFQVAAALLIPGLLVLDRARVMAWTSVMAVLLNAGLDAVLLVGFNSGIAGPAWATAAASALTWATYAVVCGQQTGVRLLLSPWWVPAAVAAAVLAK